jgi:hypothetical protein
MPSSILAKILLFGKKTAKNFGRFARCDKKTGVPATVPNVYFRLNCRPNETYNEDRNDCQ